MHDDPRIAAHPVMVNLNKLYLLNIFPPYPLRPFIEIKGKSPGIKSHIFRLAGNRSRPAAQMQKINGTSKAKTKNGKDYPAGKSITPPSILS